LGTTPALNPPTAACLATSNPAGRLNWSYLTAWPEAEPVAMIASDAKIPIPRPRWDRRCMQEFAIFPLLCLGSV
jgi:hypothetical protein